ncbi:MAG: ribosome silencing factor [Flavobacteriales bacterium]|jgi:ribosome-associated protein|nr:ribosome silencing factor [Flavobacteriales bacterium]
MKKIKQASSEHLLEVVVNAIQEVKGEEIRSLDLRDIPNSVADFFVVCHGNSNTQVQAIANRVEKDTIEAFNDRPWHTEGVRNAEWILMDYSNIVVHVFYKEAREFYALEELWADAEVKEYEYEV